MMWLKMVLSYGSVSDDQPIECHDTYPHIFSFHLFPTFDRPSSLIWCKISCSSIPCGCLKATPITSFRPMLPQIFNQSCHFHIIPIHLRFLLGNDMTTSSWVYKAVKVRPVTRSWHSRYRSRSGSSIVSMRRSISTHFKFRLHLRLATLAPSAHSMEIWLIQVHCICWGASNLALRFIPQVAVHYFWSYVQSTRICSHVIRFLPQVGVYSRSKERQGREYWQSRGTLPVA